MLSCILTRSSSQRPVAKAAVVRRAAEGKDGVGAAVAIRELVARG